MVQAGLEPQASLTVIFRLLITTSHSLSMAGVGRSINQQGIFAWNLSEGSFKVLTSKAGMESPPRNEALARNSLHQPEGIKSE